MYEYKVDHGEGMRSTEGLLVKYCLCYKNCLLRRVKVFTLD